MGGDQALVTCKRLLNTWKRLYDSENQRLILFLYFPVHNYYILYNTVYMCYYNYYTYQLCARSVIEKAVLLIKVFMQTIKKALRENMFLVVSNSTLMFHFLIQTTLFSMIF